MATYLVSEQCPVTGEIYNAGMGYFNRVSMMTGPGASVKGAGEYAAPEDVSKAMNRINSLDNPQTCGDVTAALGMMLNTLSGKAEESAAPAAEQGPSLTVAQIFENLPNAFQPENAGGVDVVFGFKITGDQGGDWSVTVKDGACECREGAHPSPTTTIIMSDEDFIALMSGKLNAMQAYTSGKLKIEGDLMKSQLIEKLFKF
jgi:putative sterol carrier protein